MDVVYVLGESGRKHRAYAIPGEAWNGAPVLGFRDSDLEALILCGDGMDSNGEGLQMDSYGQFSDLTDGESETIPSAWIVYGERLDWRIWDREGRLYFPQGRVWQLTTIAPWADYDAYLDGEWVVQD